MTFLHNICLLLTAVILCSQVAAKNPLASLIPLCSPDSPDFNECVMNSANKLLPQLRDGNRALDFPPLAPLRIPSMNIGSEGNAVFLKLALSNTLHHGFSELKFNSVNMDMSNMVWTLKGVIPVYSLTGDYKGQGKILVLPLGGEGEANITLSDVGTTLTVTGEKKMLNGEEHLDIKEAKIVFDFTPGKNYVNMKRTKGDLSNADHMSKFIRENADEVLKGIKKSLEDVYTDISTGLLRRLFNKVPYKNVIKQ